MRSPNERFHASPVLPEEWEVICQACRLPAPGELTGLKKIESGRDVAPQKVRDAASAVCFQDGGFCTITSDDHNLTTEVNSVIKRFQSDGCLPGGEIHPSNCYFKIWPQLIQVTHDTIGRPIRDDGGEINAWLNSQTNGVKKHYTLIWTLLRNPRKTKLSVEDKQQLLPGSPAKTERPSVSDVVIVTARSTRVEAKTLERKLSSAKCKIIIREDTPVDEVPRALQSAPAVVFYVGPGFDALTLGHLAAFPHHERLFLVSNVKYVDEVILIRRLSNHLKLNDSQCFEVFDDDFDAVKAAVAGTRKRAREAEETRSQLWRTWRDVEQGISSLTQSDAAETEMEILDTALLRPFRDRVMDLRHRRFAAVEQIQTDFVGVAEHVFSRAKEVYALNTDIHSTFWGGIDENVRMKYMARVPTTRLFLYSDLANLFRDIDGELTSQAAHYRDVATLLVGEFESYRSAFGQAAEDVAFIHHQSGTWYRFTLNARKFGFQTLESPGEDPQLQRLIALQNRARSTPREPIDYKNFRYFQWHDGKYDADPASQTCISSTFQFASRTRAHRVVSFQNDGQIDPKIFKGIVLQAHLALRRYEEMFREKYGLRSIHFGARSFLPEVTKVTEVTSNGALPRHVDAPCMLILTFDTSEGLNQYYQCNEIKEIRRTLYREILKALAINLDGMKAESEERLLEILEMTGSRYITRHTYTDQHDLSVWLALRGRKS